MKRLSSTPPPGVAAPPIAVPFAVEHLFVYGTLRRAVDHPMHRVLARGATSAGGAWFHGRLYDLGRFPGAVSSSHSGDRVLGELYRLGAGQGVLRSLDHYEGCDEPDALFQRTLCRAWRMEGAGLIAWVYLYQGAVKGLPRIVSGDYLSTRPGMRAHDAARVSA